MNPMPDIVFVVGGPGSGKGTLCTKLAHKFGYEHISVGDVLRDGIEKDTEEAKTISSSIEDGSLVPIDVLMKLIKNKIEKCLKQGRSKFLLDGFPRSQENIERWEKDFGSDDSMHLQFVLFLECDVETMVSRLLKRGMSSGRADDNSQTIKKRLETFREESQPIIASYKQKKMLVQVSANSSPEDVFRSASKHFKSKRPCHCFGYQ